MTVEKIVEKFGQALRKMPERKPGRSKQDYGTPADLIAAVEKRFGPIALDLAASAGNAKAKDYITEDEDSLSDGVNWIGRLKGRKIAWLNPPFGHIEPWAEKCAASAIRLQAHQRILFLTPASVGSNWYAKHIHQRYGVVFLNGRPSFDGVAGYPKDCMITCFGAPAGFEVWRWK